jgi:hypothetical protein
VILAHHGLGEELLLPALASGGSLLLWQARAMLMELRRWTRRR